MSIATATLGAGAESVARRRTALSDFPMVLNRVYPECGEAINEKMREFHENARKLHFSVFDGAVQIKLEEAGGRIIPAQRMSDGMLNWLFLLTLGSGPSSAGVY